jgi:hypothetical protein
LIFAAFAWSSMFDLKNSQPFSLTSKKQELIPPVLLTLAIIAGMVKAFPAVQNQMSKSKPYDLYADASAWLIQNTEEDELIFQTDWDDFPRLFFYNTHNTYLAGLDPTYLQIYDAELYNQWVSITRGEVENPSEIIRLQFGTRYVHTDLNHTDFIDQAENDPNMREVYRDDQSILFEVIKP